MTDIADSDVLNDAKASDGSALSDPKDSEEIMPQIKKEGTNGDAVPVAAAEEIDSTRKSDGQPGDNDSEAETLIQSPEKKRNLENEPAQVKVDQNDVAKSPNTVHDPETRSRKRKRGPNGAGEGQESRASSRRSSSLSSPVLVGRSPNSDLDDSSQSDTQNSTVGRSKRKISSKAGSENGEEKLQTKVRRRRPSDTSAPASKNRPKNQVTVVDAAQAERRETRSATFPRQSSEDRSPSPHPTTRREHRRGVSTQFTTGDLDRKRRGRPPLINTRRNKSLERAASPSSDDSSSPPPHRPSLTKFTSTDPDIMSPAKATGPRKWRDKNGRTFLSRACNNNDLETAKARFAERPEDLNLADNAGNTPLQIAALEGFVDIVRFLLESNCKVDTQNIDKETPLIDAVENGHVEVVKLLLDHGANPRLGNAKGDEPYELVPPDDGNYKIVRKLLADARERDVKKRKSTETNDSQRERERERDRDRDRDGGSSRAASAASPRDSPPITGPRSPPTLASRRRTGRSESTRNDLLWQANTQENLKRLAAKGDVQGVASILNILQKAETESLIAAAKAGHEEVLQYLLGMGNPDPDPQPVLNLKPGFNTPVLAAIGRGNPDVIKLLVEQSGFDPARKFRGKTYFEIAAERRGEQWQAEYGILKAAFDRSSTAKNRKQTSPRKTKDMDRLKPKQNNNSSSPNSNNLQNPSSPSISHKTLPTKSIESFSKEKRRDTGSTEIADRRKEPNMKKERRDNSVAVVSDHEANISAPKKTQKIRRSQSDMSQRPDLENESSQRRRRLVTGKEHRRRKSLVTGNSSDESGSETDVKGEARTTSLKRVRNSHSPELNQSKDVEPRSMTKKRRTVADSSPEVSKSELKKKLPRNGGSEANRDIDMPDAETKPQDDGDKVVHSSKTNTSKKKSNNEAEIKQDAETIAAVESEDKANEDTSSATPQNNVKREASTSSIEKAELERQKAQEDAEKAAAEVKKAEEERIAAENAENERRLAAEAEVRRKAEEEEEEAAATLARKREEEERQERIKREQEERQRRQEELIRLQRIELERQRREALPAILCRSALMLDDGDLSAKRPQWLSKFLPLFTVQTQQLDRDCPPTLQEEEWVPNFQVAGLLATKDLSLRSYTSFEKIPVQPAVRECLWKVARNMLSYDYDTNSLNTSIKQAIEREKEQKPKFFAMEELFWVKLSDFQDQLFGHDHLADLQLKKQRISLRSFREDSSDLHLSQPNGIMQASPILTNGILPSVHQHTPIYGNGHTRL